MKNEVLRILQESATDLAENYGINMMNQEDMIKALSEDASRNILIEKTLEETDFSPEEADGFRLFAENSVTEFVSEASSSAEIRPYAPFQLTLLKELYARRIGRKLLTVEPMTSTSHSFGLLKTVLVDIDGKEFDLNEIDTATQINEGWKESEVAVNTPAALLDVAGTVYDPAQATNAGFLTQVEIDDITSGATKKAQLDIGSYISSVEVGGVMYPANVVMGEDGSYNAIVEFTVAATGTAPAIKKMTRIYGVMDFDLGEFVVHSGVTGADAVTKVVYSHRLTNTWQENNTLQMRLKYDKYKVAIGDGTTIESAIPLNYLQDLKAWINIDGLATAVRRLAESFVVIDDRKILKEANDAAARSGNITTFNKYVQGGAANISVVDYNRGLLYELNQAIAIVDSKTQFTGINTINVASNPVDASTLFSPVVIANDDKNTIDNSLIGGAYSYKTTQVVSAVGNVNILSTKIQEIGKMVIVPKSSSVDEKIFNQYMYSSILLTDSTYRNRTAPLVKNLLVKERSELVVHTDQAFGLVELV